MTTETPKFCPNCGTPTSGQPFCTSCGKPLTVTPTPTPAATNTPIRRSLWGYIVITLLLLGGLYWFVVAPALDHAAATTPHDITYRISGTARTVDLTYRNANDSTDQQQNKSIPWKMSFTAYRGQSLYVSAQNLGETGTVTCELVVDGVVVKAAESSGPQVVVTCNARL